MSNDLLVCPYCGEDRNKNITDVKQLCKDNGLTNEMCNPGGRELIFGTKRLQIGDMCNSCDEKKIREFLKKLTGSYNHL